MDDFFNPKTIVKENFKIAIIYTTERIGSNKTKYIQAKVYFDLNGKILIKKIFYNGKAATIIEYKRNSNGLIKLKTRHSMDSLENKSDFMSPEIEDFEYENSLNLIKVKKRDHRGNIVPDNMTEYTKYEYDKLNRVIREYRYAYYEANSVSSYDQNFEYLTNGDSKSITLDNGVPWMLTISKYNSNSRLISQVDYDMPNSKMLTEEHYKYNESNQMISFSVTQKNGSGINGCPENDNYSENYTYDSKKLLDRIIHRFQNVICEMEVKYE